VTGGVHLAVLDLTEDPLVNDRGPNDNGETSEPSSCTGWTNSMVVRTFATAIAGVLHLPIDHAWLHTDGELCRMLLRLKLAL
jgi:hypothetical protein